MWCLLLIVNLLLCAPFPPQETAPASHPAVNAPKEAHGFTLVEQQYLAEYDSTALLYRHKKTGTVILGLAGDLSWNAMHA